MLKANFNGVWFTATQGPNRSHCMFNRERAAVCTAANHAAVAAGLPDCDDADPDGTGFVYVSHGVDPRQLDILSEETEK